MGHKPLLIAMCGPDGSGKSSAAGYVQEMLNQYSVPNIVIKPLLPERRFVTGLHDLKKHRLKGSKKLESFMADYFSFKLLNTIHTTILPALSDGKTVICDRYVYSHFVNQSVFGNDIEEDPDIWGWIPKPDLTFYFDVPVEVAINRLNRRTKKGVGDNLEFLTKAKKKFDEFAERENFYRIDATGDQQLLCIEIFSEIKKKWGEPG
ncbi:dTMP kinase [Paenibacillus sp. DMB20]|uniref:dTMP kinase n=1 Tax=Paenibacillus sp. DMB20 TaxID=1642570 RepID=UPI0009E2030E|nr:hypothetical protein [Paenibacillus sp. DMB20]